jgi:hypothetical protein
MGRMVTIPIRNVTILASDADHDIWEIACSASFRGALHMMSLTSNAAAEQFLDLSLVRRSTSGTGTAITEIQDDQGNARTPSFTAKHTIAAPGTLVSSGIAWQWGMRNELLYIPTPECREIISESGIIALNCLTSITGSIKVSGFIKVEEF